MNQFTLSREKQIISRLYFYAATGCICWAVGNLIPTSSEVQAEQDRRLGVATPYVGVPIEKVPEIKNLNH